MASEYLKWKYRDVKPREKVELTPAEKRKNWWHYHKWHFVIGVVLALSAASLLWEMLGIGGVKPDYQFAYVGTDALPEETVSALETGLAAFGTDQNGDGVVAISIHQYLIYNADAETAAAAQIRLVADLNGYESFFFLLEDPEQFQQDYRSLCSRIDGSLPEEGGSSAGGTYLLWTQCPALTALELGSCTYGVLGETVTGDSGELVSGLALARRGFWTEKTTLYPEGCETLWAVLTDGAAA